MVIDFNSGKSPCIVSGGWLRRYCLRRFDADKSIKALSSIAPGTQATQYLWLQITGVPATLCVDLQLKENSDSVTSMLNYLAVGNWLYQLLVICRKTIDCNIAGVSEWHTVQAFPNRYNIYATRLGRYCHIY